ncbi:hypothetical protein FBZ87_102580 [Nitrospirillum amazonense]|uniref:Uncharacterized protein n=1 Tax=Nitrospirillum amazonense TaxID=28077 RepID=A0A560KAD1_9PROT|nr:hypothetical protein [Nitrospirillum amazonense]TWB80156.1 hypothetical protein FBZ87_102580 [Nitrospirillum amazonense]
MVATPTSTAATPTGPAADKVSLRTLTVVRHVLLGLGFGLIPMVIFVMRHDLPTSRGALVGSVLGGALGGMASMGLIGAYRARSIPPEQPSAIGRLRLTLGLAPLALIFVGLAALMVI